MSINETEWKKRAANLIATFNKRTVLFERYRSIYFMENMEAAKGGAIDKKDWKLTPSPNGRNEVVGMHRLLDTGEMNVEIRAGKGGERVDVIEQALKDMIAISSQNGLASVTSDAMLSAVLYGPVVLYAESVGDLLTSKSLKPYRRHHLEKMLDRTPFLIKTINPEESFIEMDDGQIIYHVWKYKLTGAVLKSRFGLAQANDNQNYVVYDCYDPEYHYVWADGISTPIVSGAHGLGCVPMAVSYSGGTNLFHDPHHQVQSFLYAKVMGDLDKRENSVLTAIFTQLHRRGMLGEMYWIDPTDAPETIKIDYQDGVFFAKGKVSAKSDRIIDPVVFEIKGLLDELSGQSTIYKQTLGENIGSQTFSGLAMLSSAGKLPLVSPERALSAAFRDIFEHVLYRIKNEGIENEQIQAADIPDDVNITVTFSPKLPQDQLRNAQVAGQIGNKVSTEWIHSNLLQINDTPAMEKQIMKEQMKAAIFGAIVQDPNTMQKIIQSIVGAPPQQQGQPGQPPPDMQGQDPNMQGQPSPEQMAMMMQQQQGQQQGQPTPEQMAMMQAQSQRGQPNMMQPEMAGPMTPPQEMQ